MSETIPVENIEENSETASKGGSWEDVLRTIREEVAKKRKGNLPPNNGSEEPTIVMKR